MAHPGEPVGDAGALLGNLLEDSGPSVADDVVVALHFPGCLRVDSLHRSSSPGRAAAPASALPGRDATRLDSTVRAVRFADRRGELAEVRASGATPARTARCIEMA